MDRPDPNEPSAAPGPAAGDPPPPGSDPPPLNGYPLPPGYPPPGYPPPGWYPPPDYPPPGYPPPDYPPPGYPPPGPFPPAPPPGYPPPELPPVSDVPFLDVPGAPPTTRGAAGFWFLFALIGFAGGEIVALIATEIAASLAGQGGQLQKIAAMTQPPEWYVGASLVGLWVGFLAGPWLASKVRGTGRFLVDLGVRFRWVDLVGIVIGIGGQILVALLYAPFRSHLKNFTAPTQKLTGASHGGGFAVIAILTVVGAPFFEELFFRGLLFKALARLFTPTTIGPSARRTIGLVGAVVVDGVLFGLAHGELEQLAGLAVFGMILAIVSYRTGRLGMNMVSHASFNLVAVVAVLSTRNGVIH